MTRPITFVSSQCHESLANLPVLQRSPVLQFYELHDLHLKSMQFIELRYRPSGGNLPYALPP